VGGLESLDAQNRLGRRFARHEVEMDEKAAGPRIRPPSTATAIRTPFSHVR